MIRCALISIAVLALAAQETPNLVPMGYTSLGPDGQPGGVVVALTKPQFAALLATATATARPAEAALPTLAIGPGAWTARWRDGRWSFAGTVPVAAPGAAWGEVRLAVPGTVAGASFGPLAGSATPGQAAWRREGDSVVLALPPRSQATVELAVEREAALGTAVELAFPPGGALSFDLPAGLVAESRGGFLGDGIALPQDGRLALTVSRPVAASDPGSLGLVQHLRLQHHGDRIAWHAEISLDGQRRAPRAVDLGLPAGLDVLAATGEALATWRQREGRLELRWSADDRERTRRAVLDGVIVAGVDVAPLLALGSAVRGGGSVGVIDAGPVRWSVPEAGPALRRTQPGEGERYRIAWDGAAPPALRLAWAAAADRLGVDSDGLLVVEPGRWRAELAFTLAGTGLLDHLRVAVPAPWRVVSSQGAAWLPAGEGVVELCGANPLASGARIVLRCEAPDGAEGLPPIHALDGTGRTRWLLADRGSLRVGATGGGADSEALLADLARAGIRPGAEERVRSAIEVRAGAATSLRVAPEERRARIEAAHYLIAGPGAARWSCRLSVRPEAGALERVRIRLPAGVRLIERRGEAVATWSEADGWLSAVFAAPLDRPTVLELGFAADWSEAGGRDRLELGSLLTEPALGAETVALAEDEEAGQLLRRGDGLEERPAVPLPLGVAAPLLAGRSWAATGTVWKLALERERLDPGLGADGVASLVDVHSAIDPDGRLVSRATWYVINRSRPALALRLPEGCALWELRVGGLPVRARSGPGGLSVPVPPLRPGEAATRIQVCWSQEAAAGDLRPRLPLLSDLRVMRALWRFTAPPGVRLAHVDGWEPVAASDASGARVEVLADELKRLRATGEENAAVRGRLEDQLRLIDQELADHLAVLERLGQDPSRWAGDITARQANAVQQQELQTRNQSFNSLVQGNQQELRSKLGKLSSVARAQRDRRGGLLLDGQAIRWAAPTSDGALGPDWAARVVPEAVADAPAVAVIAHGLGAGTGVGGAAATAALSGIDLLPAQDGEELTLRADNLGAQPVLRLSAGRAGGRWWPLGLGLAALLAIAAACLLRSQAPRLGG